MVYEGSFSYQNGRTLGGLGKKLLEFKFMKELPTSGSRPAGLICRLSVIQNIVHLDSAHRLV